MPRFSIADGIDLIAASIPMAALAIVGLIGATYFSILGYILLSQKFCIPGLILVVQ